MMGINFSLSAQTPVASWQQVNTPGQDVPWSAMRMPDGVIILSAIQNATVFAKQKLLMVKLDETGKPSFKNEIAFADTGIVYTAGIFPWGNSGYLVFAAFAVDSPYVFAKQFGYLLLDSNFVLQKTQFINIGVHPLATIETANMKWDKTASEYYGIQMIFNTPGADKFVNYTYGNLLILDSMLTVQVSVPDSHAINAFDSTWFGQDIGYGNWCRFNDSIYNIIYSGGYFYGTTNRVFNRNNNTSRNGINAILLDSIYSPYYYHFVDLTGFTITLEKYTDSTLLVAGTVKQHIAPQEAEDTLLEINMELGQSVIAEVNPITYWAYNYHLFEPWKLESGNSGSYAREYYAGIANNFDKLYPNQLFYTRVLNDGGFYTQSGSVVKVTALNKQLKPKWTVSINDIGDNATEAPYNIVATADSGCILFTRKMVRLYVEPYFGNKADFPEYDITVYKINNNGIVTGTYNLSEFITAKKSVFVYPNPTTEFIAFKNLEVDQYYDLIIYNMFGNEVLQKSINDQTQINIQEFKKGLYLYNLHSAKQGIVTGKFLVE